MLKSWGQRAVTWNYPKHFNAFLETTFLKTDYTNIHLNQTLFVFFWAFTRLPAFICCLNHCKVCRWFWFFITPIGFVCSYLLKNFLTCLQWWEKNKTKQNKINPIELLLSWSKTGTSAYCHCPQILWKWKNLTNFSQKNIRITLLSPQFSVENWHNKSWESTIWC